MSTTVICATIVVTRTGMPFYKHREDVYDMEETPLHTVIEPEFEDVRHEYHVYSPLVMLDVSWTTVDIRRNGDTGAYMYIHNGICYDIRFPLYHALSFAPYAGPEHCAECHVRGHVNGAFVRMCAECSRVCDAVPVAERSVRAIGYDASAYNCTFVPHRAAIPVRKLSLIHPDLLEKAESPSLPWCLTDVC